MIVGDADQTAAGLRGLLHDPCGDELTAKDWHRMDETRPGEERVQTFLGDDGVFPGGLVDELVLRLSREARPLVRLVPRFEGKLAGWTRQSAAEPRVDIAAGGSKERDSAGDQFLFGAIVGNDVLHERHGDRVETRRLRVEVVESVPLCWATRPPSDAPSALARA